MVAETGEAHVVPLRGVAEIGARSSEQGVLFIAGLSLWNQRESTIGTEPFGTRRVHGVRFARDTLKDMGPETRSLRRSRIVLATVTGMALILGGYLLTRTLPGSRNGSLRSQSQPGASDSSADSADSLLASDRELDRAPSNSDTLKTRGDGPPLTNGVHIQRGICPFEGCVYRQWRATEDVVLLEAPDDRSDSVAVIQRGEDVVAETGEVHVIPLRGVVVRPLGNFRPGDTVFRLSYRGEGTWDIWHNGRVADTHNLDYWSGDKPVFDFGPNASAQGQATWWVKIRRSNGDRGWTHDTEHFAGKDRLG